MCLLFRLFVCLFVCLCRNMCLTTCWGQSGILAKVVDAKYKALKMKDISSKLFVCLFDCVFSGGSLFVYLFVCLFVCLLVCVCVCLCVRLFRFFNCVGHIWRLPLKVHMYWLNVQVICAGVPPLNTLKLGTVPQYRILKGATIAIFSLCWTV